MMPPIHLRPYSTSDLAACLRLFDVNCPDFFAPNERSDYRSFLDAGKAGYFVGCLGADIVAAFGVIDEGIRARRRLNWILIDRAFQSKGLGRAVMEFVRSRAVSAGASCIDIAASHKSEAFFSRFGAVELSRQIDGWGLGMHRVDMEWRVV